MPRAPAQRILGLLLIASGLIMLPSMLIGLLHRDGTEVLFGSCALALVGVGSVCWVPVRHVRRELRIRDGFLIAAMAWTVTSAASALPLWWHGGPALPVIDALFESVSAITTTGSTVITNLDELPQGLLFHRAFLQWLGGMGLIVLAVAILPALRIGGMQLFRTEYPGPVKDNKLTPRITETAKALWKIYLALTVICMLAYWLAGMGLFDAACHAFTTIATAGFSTHDASLAWFNSTLIEMLAVIFMVLASMNFALHFAAWRRASAQIYFNEPELKVFIGLVAVFAVVASAQLYLGGQYPDSGDALRFGIFQAVTALTTTGYTTAPFHEWFGYLPYLLIAMASIGACAGSTAGGIKVIRLILLVKQAGREIRRLIHPRAVMPVKLAGRRTSDRVISAVWAFFFCYVASFLLLSLLLMASGHDPITSFSAVGATLSNLGPALGEAGPHYAELGAFAKLVLIFSMLLGRLEIFTLLVLVTPTFWRD